MHESHVRAGLGAGQPNCTRQRQPEHAEAVSHANAQMNAERRWWHQPAIKSRPCDRAFAIENSDVTAADGSSAIKCNHCNPFSREPAPRDLCIRWSSDLKVPGAEVCTAALHNPGSAALRRSNV